MTRAVRWLTLLAGLSALAGGCAPAFGPRARYGITFYCPGVGNFDRGDAGIREGLERAGYRGQIARFNWSYSFNPALDQTLRPIARLGAARLAATIQDYLDRYPGREVNLIGLSAGSGVAIFALERLKPGYKVNNVVLIASSLYHRYDISKALPRIRGKIYCFYSPQDAVLSGPMKVFGTIDGVLFADGAGAVGLQPPRGADRVVNIRWRPEFERYGYYGGHIDGTSPAFVRHYIARHIVSPTGPSTPPERDATRRLAGDPRGAPED